VTIGDSRGRTILGFGGAFTEAAAVALSQLSPARREEALRAYFDPETGSAYNLCRTHINSCDFSLSNYAYNETAGDVELEQFDISRDRKLLIPLIQDAQRIAGHSLRLLASPWSPPAWMKTNGKMNGGGQLRPEYRQAWALYFARYIQAYAAEGLDIWAVTVQNEPQATQTWDSCIYSHEEQRDFVRDYLGPTLRAEGLGHVKILIWDHNRDEMFDCAQAILSDPEAAQYVWGVGFHWYSGDDFTNVARVREAFPDVQLVFTEGCQERGVKLGSWKLGERYAHEIIGDLNHGATAWIDWNMVLDAQGGPNHVGNYCDAPLIADAEHDAIHYQNAYYYLRHFSAGIREGATILSTESSHPALETLGCRNPDGAVAVVVLNRSEEAIPFQLMGTGLAADAEIPARAIATFTYHDG
jgi:glucosylceramidase